MCFRHFMPCQNRPEPVELLATPHAPPPFAAHPHLFMYVMSNPYRLTVQTSHIPVYTCRSCQSNWRQNSHAQVRDGPPLLSRPSAILQRPVIVTSDQAHRSDPYLCTAVDDPPVFRFPRHVHVRVPDFVHLTSTSQYRRRH